MKALILAAGRGTRLRPLSNTMPKHLIPVANKPILFYVMEQIKEAGIEDVGIVVSPDTFADLKAAVLDGSKWEMKINYIVQTEPKGLAHAVKAGAGFLGNSDFLLFLGDNLIKDGVKDLITEFKSHRPDALIVLKEVADPRAFGVAEVDSTGKVVRVVEKPKEPKSNLALVGAYVFTPEVHLAIDQLKPSWRGEYEITDAIQKLLDVGKNVRSHILRGWWLDTGKKEDLLEANRIILDDNLQRGIHGQVDEKSLVLGRIEIREGAKIENSVIRGPVSIAENCQIINSFIGPFTSISAETKIENSSVEYSIILNNCRISEIPRLADSVIGRNAEMIGKGQGQRKASVFIGDYSRIDL
jgi:glucose-1-phosphate thymidylyltransferase